MKNDRVHVGTETVSREETGDAGEYDTRVCGPGKGI